MRWTARRKMRRFTRMIARLAACLDDGQALVIKQDGQPHVWTIADVEAKRGKQVETMFADNSPYMVSTGSRLEISGRIIDPPFIEREEGTDGLGDR